MAVFTPGIRPPFKYHWYVAPPLAESVTEDPSQIKVLGGVARLAAGVGCTMILKDRGKPVQVTPAIVLLGVIVMEATIGTVVGLVAMKEAILPVPEAGKPMEVLLFVQLKTVPATNPLMTIVEVGKPLQTD